MQWFTQWKATVIRWITARKKGTFSFADTKKHLLEEERK
jgi:hypothetical protein